MTTYQESVAHRRQEARQNAIEMWGEDAYQQNAEMLWIGDGRDEWPGFDGLSLLEAQWMISEITLRIEGSLVNARMQIEQLETQRDKLLKRNGELMEILAEHGIEI